MKNLKVLYFFSILCFSLYITLLYKVNLFVTIPNDILHKFDLKICHKKERNLAEGSSLGLNRKRKHDGSLTYDESLSVSTAGDIEFLALKLSTQKVVDNFGGLNEDAMNNIGIFCNIILPLLRTYKIIYSEEKIRNMAMRIICRIREIFSDGPLTTDQINCRLKLYMFENVLSYHVLKEASCKSNEEERNRVIDDIDSIKGLVNNTFNDSKVVLQEHMVNSMALRISESIRDLFDELYPNELGSAKNERTN
ncbi:hypothetical protein PRELSG_0015400 [Plasmodium relictum]|uniref:Gametocyte associated protein n=1 Tax=Plasmodium relictum TaxID=85471 RepID=A0A1J1GKQ9_PLARL|nr:hypothetical protein PRELSG_0015400 [Plasmodium relictum]CRG85804.1 hypothetical protein PRELSG_0015400 [Plasmodium relictum]